MATIVGSEADEIRLLIEAREAAGSGRAARLRRAAGLSQREVARAVGVTAGCITRWENGERRPTGPAALEYGRVLREIAEGLLR
jgi:DNA-binding transcriptional regulator YiaG